MEAGGHGNANLLLPSKGRRLTISALFLLLPLCLHLAALFCLHLAALYLTSRLPLAYASNYPTGPSTNWSFLPDYYRLLPPNPSNFSAMSENIFPFPYYRFNNFKLCNNDSTYLELLNGEEGGVYGRAPLRYSDDENDTLDHNSVFIDSAHFDMVLAVSFRIYFVRSADTVCMITRNASARAYYLSVVAFIFDTFNMGDQNRGQVIWTANRGRPVSENSCLHLGEDSNLKLVEYSDNIQQPEIVWESNTTGLALNASLAITFEGNMVLFSDTTDPPYVPLWQSHRNPTDTLMVLQVLENTSTLSFNNTADSPAADSGNYTMAIVNGKLTLYARIGQQHDHEVTPYGSPYWVLSDSNSSSAHDVTFATLCWDPVNQLRLYVGSNRSEASMEIPPESCSSISGDTQSMQDQNQQKNLTYATFLRLEADGDLRAYTVNDVDPDVRNTTAVWRSFYSVFNRMRCKLPLYCGFYGICDPESGNYDCACDANFEYADNSNNRSGCKLVTGTLPTHGSLCDSSGAIDFVEIKDVHYFSVDFTNPENQIETSDSCKNRCRQDCNCTAVFWSQRDSSCFLIRGQVGTIQRRGDIVAFIKYVTPPTPTNLIMVGSVVAAAVFTFVMICMCLVYLRKRREAHIRRSAEMENERLLLLLLEGSNPERFTWKQMHEYTCGFSDPLGSGGFGRVYRGSLPDGAAVAVKELDTDGSQGQGNKEFIAEVSILSGIHHAHLVHLIGFCLEGKHRLLVYEYMENGSLDSWLFQNPQQVLQQEADDEVLHIMQAKNNAVHRREVLPWKTRFQIAVGTAKGLAYLHEECEDRVIHMDLKPQNILLGRNFTPKISDFGMSTRIAREQTAVMTVMRGTPGYLAPEWLLDCAVTDKCDVFSFGLVLLEMVSGRRIRDVNEAKQNLGMRPLRESVMQDLVDENLKMNGSEMEEEDVMRMVEVALMCVSRDPARRPAMSLVARMLEGKAQMGQSALDDDEEQQQQLVMYPSSRKKSMRMGKNFQSYSFNISQFLSEAAWSSDGSSSSNNTMIMNRKKKYSHVDRCQNASESDHLVLHS